MSPWMRATIPSTIRGTYEKVATTIAAFSVCVASTNFPTNQIRKPITRIAIGAPTTAPTVANVPATFRLAASWSAVAFCTRALARAISASMMGSNRSRFAMKTAPARTVTISIGIQKSRSARRANTADGA